jgi:nitrous oxidase accessory protein NosD
MSLFALAVLLAAADAAAGIPVHQPISIGQPGKYVVVRNISGPGTLIKIESGGVDLDLNGFVIESTTSVSPAIQIFPPPPAGELVQVAIRDGAVRGGSAALFADRVTGLRLSDLVTAASSTGLHIDDVKAAVIERNQIAASTVGLFVGDCENCRVSDNTVMGGVELGLGVVFALGGEIAGNRVAHSIRCIDVQGNGTLVRDNVVVSCVDAMTIGVFDGVISGNVLSASRLGLKLGPASQRNVYRANTARGCATGFLDEGSGNTSHGDNYLPDRR